MNNINNKFVSTEYIENLIGKYCPNKKINNLNLYQKAFVHKSFLIVDYDNDSADEECLMTRPDYLLDSNERLEFLGDCILNFIVGEYLFDKYGTKNEGFLTTLRTKIVRSEKLAEFAELLGFKQYLLLSSHIERITAPLKGRNSPRFLEDTFESFIGALYKDFNDDGLHVCRKFIIGVIEEFTDFNTLINLNDNWKDSLLRYYQLKLWSHPVYETISEEISDQKYFNIVVVLSKEKEVSEKEKKAFLESEKKIIDTIPLDARNRLYELMKHNYILGVARAPKKKIGEQICSKMALKTLKVSLNF